MGKNSIEEDIKCVQDFLEYSQDMINDMDYERPVDVTIYQQQINSMQHILSDYKRVLKMNEVLLKENEELKETYKSEKKMKNEYVKLYQDLLLKENVIPIQKIKDKIEELNKEIKSCAEIDAIFKIKQQQILQELLESEE